DKHRAAAVAVFSLPGAKLLHEGQFQGRRTRVPVFLKRRLEEAPDLDLERFYHNLLRETAQEPFRTGEWSLCECSGWPDNMSCRNVLAWCWKRGSSRCLVILNLSQTSSQARVLAPWSDAAARLWRLMDPLSGEAYDRQGDELVGPGLYVSLDPWRWHFFRLEAVG
ncbi:MAG: alpha-amylase, partial [Nitrospiraceae bacterium]